MWACCGKKNLAHFMTNHTKNVLGAKAAYIAFKKKKMSQVDTKRQTALEMHTLQVHEKHHPSRT